MKVALIVDSYKSWTGGPSEILKETKKALQKKGIKVSIISKDILKKKKFYLRNELKKFDICHLYGGWTFFHIKTYLVALSLKKKIIIHPLGFYEPWSLTQKKFKKKIALKLYQSKILMNSNLIHCASKLEQKNILKINKDFKTKVIPYGILNKYIKKTVKKKKISKRAIFFSRIHKKKGVENLINAWKKVNNHDWKLDIYGPPENEKYLNQLISSINKDDRIKIFKPIYNTKIKFKTFEKYDFMILPTYSENFGFIVLEALARGLPVLTTKNTPWDKIKKKDSGWISGNSINSLTLTLKKIFNLSNGNINYFYKKSKNAISHANIYNWDYISENYLNTYKKILDE